MDAAHFDDLRGRLDGLLISLGERLPRRDIALLVEFLDANEFGLTLEQMADVLSEDAVPISDEERADMVSLAAAMSLGPRVAGALEFCPRREVEAS